MPRAEWLNMKNSSYLSLALINGVGNASRELRGLLSGALRQLAPLANQEPCIAK